MGKLIVNEKNDVKGNLVCLFEQEMNIPSAKEKKQIVRAKMVFQGGKSFPVTYSCDSSPGVTYSIEIENDKIVRMLKNKNGKKENVKPYKPEMTLLDLVVYPTVTYLIRQYDANKGGDQFFQTYTLPYDSVEKIAVIPKKITMPEHETRELQLKNYEIEVREDLKLLVWIDKDKHLYRMFAQGPNVEVIRSDLFDRLNKKMESRDK